MKRKEWRNTKFTELLNLEFPIVQGPFGGGASSVELTATVSRLGGLGSFGCQPYTAEEILVYSEAIRGKTDKPFNLNLWVNDWDAEMSDFEIDDFNRLSALFKPYLEELDLPSPQWPKDLGPRYTEQVAAILEAKPAVFSFMFGIPAKKILEACRKNGILTVGTVTTVDEAIAMEMAGVDAIVASGFEAGGHRASFIRSADESLFGTFSLIPQVVDQVTIPVIAAGGIADGRGIRAAMALGADAVQIGTAFLATNQSNALTEHKKRLFSEDAKYTTLTKLFSGRLARGLKSKLTEELKEKEHCFAPYPMQRKFMSQLTAELVRKGKSGYPTFAAGQSASLLRFRDAATFFRALVNETDLLFQ